MRQFYSTRLTSSMRQFYSTQPVYNLTARLFNSDFCYFRYHLWFPIEVVHLPGRWSPSFSVFICFEHIRASEHISRYYFAVSVHSVWTLILLTWSIHLIHDDLGLQSRVMRQERVEQLDAVLNIIRTTRLADRVHAQLGVAQIQRPYAKLGRQHGTDGRTTWAVVSHDKQLKGNTRLFGDLLQEDDAWRVGGVSLVGVDLNHGALVHFWLVAGLVFAGVVRVHWRHSVRKQFQLHGPR